MKVGGKLDVKRINSNIFLFAMREEKIYKFPNN